MNAKRKGNRAEHRSMLLLESAGYACTRAVASLGVFDIVGVSPTDVVLVQVKSRDWPGSIEMEAIRNFQCPPLCKKIFHRWRDRARLPDVASPDCISNPGAILPALKAISDAMDAPLVPVSP